MKKFALLLALLCLMAGQALAQRGKIVTDTIYSQVLSAPRAYTVYLPPSFESAPEKQYPVLYLLHGLSGNNSDWSTLAQLRLIADLLIRSGQAPEMVIVTSDADNGMGPDMQPGYFNVPGWAYEDFFFQEFIPEIEKRYRAIGDKDHRAIAGLSMGGGGTTAYAQHHPELFHSAYPMSALMTLPEGRLPQKPLNEYTHRDHYNQAVNDNDCVAFVVNADEPTKQALRTVRWLVDCGDDDFLLDGNLEFYKAMRQNGIPCELRIRDGVHDWAFWNSALYTLLPFAFQ